MVGFFFTHVIINRCVPRVVKKYPLFHRNILLFQPLIYCFWLLHWLCLGSRILLRREQNYRFEAAWRYGMPGASRRFLKSRSKSIGCRIWIWSGLLFTMRLIISV